METCGKREKHFAWVCARPIATPRRGLVANPSSSGEKNPKNGEKCRKMSWFSCNIRNAKLQNVLEITCTAHFVHARWKYPFGTSCTLLAFHEPKISLTNTRENLVGQQKVSVCLFATRISEAWQHCPVCQTLFFLSLVFFSSYVSAGNKTLRKCNEQALKLHTFPGESVNIAWLAFKLFHTRVCIWLPIAVMDFSWCYIANGKSVSDRERLSSVRKVKNRFPSINS